MSEQFNQDMSLTGRIPSGLLNDMFEFSGCWTKDQANTKTLAFDGVFITLYTVGLENSHIGLCDHVKKAVPTSWEPAALSRFIETFGTHIIVCVKMGGKDVIYVKQQHSSTCQPIYVEKKLNEIADERFLDANGQLSKASGDVYQIDKGTLSDITYLKSSARGILSISKRRGGSHDRNLSHNDWSDTVKLEPDVISMSFIPITHLMGGVFGSGFLSHAINLYLRYKPPIEDLRHFLEFQLPRQWAPVFNELPLRPLQNKQRVVSLQFKFLGPKLYVNTTQVDVGKRPVTGLRLYLEGNRSNRLAIYMQHFSSLPKIFQLRDDPNGNFRQESYDQKYCEKVQWKCFSHVCTAPVESSEHHSIVTGAQLQVENYGLKSTLFLRLSFSTVLGATVARSPEWDGSSEMVTLISSQSTTERKSKADVNMGSSVYPGGPPLPNRAPKLLKLVDTKEITRGPDAFPGCWVVSGAKLVVEGQDCCSG